VQYAEMVAESLEDGAIPLILRAAVLEIRPREPRLTTAAFLERQQQLQIMLDRATARGEQAPTVEELLELVGAPLYSRAHDPTSARKRHTPSRRPAPRGRCSP